MFIIIIIIRRLNKLPEVRTFLKTPGNADQYQNLEIKWVAGQSPHLKLYDDNNTFLEEIDLAHVSIRMLLLL